MEILWKWQTYEETHVKHHKTDEYDSDDDDCDDYYDPDYDYEEDNDNTGYKIVVRQN